MASNIGSSQYAKTGTALAAGICVLAVFLFLFWRINLLTYRLRVLEVYNEALPMTGIDRKSAIAFFKARSAHVSRQDDGFVLFDFGEPPYGLLERYAIVAEFENDRLVRTKLQIIHLSL